MSIIHSLTANTHRSILRLATLPLCPSPNLSHVLARLTSCQASRNFVAPAGGRPLCLTRSYQGFSQLSPLLDKFDGGTLTKSSATRLRLAREYDPSNTNNHQLVLCLSSKVSTNRRNGYVTLRDIVKIIYTVLLKEIPCNFTRQPLPISPLSISFLLMSGYGKVSE